MSTTFGSVTIAGQSLKTYEDTSVSGKKTTYYLDGSYEIVGSKTEDLTTGEVSEIIKLPASSGGGFVETGSYRESTSATAFTWEYTYDANNVFTGGKEVDDGVTKTVNADWTIASEAADLSKMTLVSDTAGLAPGALATSGAVYKLELDLGGGNKDITFFDATGAITGYQSVWSDAGTSMQGSAFFNASDVWVGDTFTDGYLTNTNFVSYGTNGEYTESGTYTETDGSTTTLFSKSYSYTFDSSNNLVSGTETVDGVTTTYGKNWSVTSASISLGSLTTTAAGDDVPSSFVFNGNTYTKTETHQWGTETEYYSDQGVLVGYSNESTFTFFDSFRNENITNTGKSFFDKDWKWVGDIFSDGYWSSQRFEVDNGNGTFTERGSESDDTGWSREWVFLFDDQHKLLSGTQTENGITTTFGADWIILGQSADVSNLGRLEAQASLDALPDVFVLKDSTTSSDYALYKTQSNPWGNETTYFAADGTILGYAYSWSDPYSGGSGVSYNDANWGYLGDTYTDGTRTTTRFETDNGDNTRTETGTEYVDGTLVRSWTFKFDSSWNLIEGTEVRDGVTTKFGANWAILGESADVSGLTAITDLNVIVDGELKLSDLYDFSADVDGTTVTAGYSSTKKSDWGDGSETVYYNAAGAIVGRVNEFSFTFTDYFDGTTKTQTGKTYFDDEWDWIGDIFDDGTWAGSRFEFDLTGGGRKEIGSEGDGSWQRSWEYTFDSSGNLVEGTEVDNGITITYGANWTVTSKAADTTNLTRSATLDDLPTQFVLTDSTGDYVLYKENVAQWGTDRTYFDATGKIIGYSNSWQGPWGSGTNFNDADWTYIGDVFIEKDGSRKNVRFETDNGDGTRTETGSEYVLNSTTQAWTVQRSWDFDFDNNWNLIEGTETRSDGTIVSFGANWIIKAEKVDVSNMTEITATLGNDIAGGVSLDAMFDFTTKDASGATVKKGYASTKTMDWNANGKETTYYNADGEVVGRYNDFVRTPQEDDYEIPFQFFRGETKGGGTIDMLGLGVDGLVADLSGSAVIVILGANLGTGEALPTTAAEFHALAANYEFDTGIPASEAYGPGNKGWLASLSNPTTSEGVTTVAGLTGFVITGVNSATPTMIGEVNVDIVSSDTLEYEYTWEGDAYFPTTPLQTSVTISGTVNGTTIPATDIIQASVDLVDNNPPTEKQFFDADWNFVGNIYQDVYWTDARFEIKDATTGGYKEVGFSGNAYMSEEYVYNYDATGAFTGGEKSENGIVREVNSSGDVTKQTVDVSRLKSSTDAADLEGVPSALIFDDSGTPTIFYIEEMHPGGIDTTYFTDTGTLLGFAYAWQDSNYGSKGIFYEDATRDYLGDIYVDGSRTTSRYETDNGNGTKTETGAEYNGTTLVRSWTYTFDTTNNNYSLLSGTETREDGTIVEYGANWEIKEEKLDVTSALTSGKLNVLTDANAATDGIFKQDAVLKGTETGSLVDGTVKLSDLYDFSSDLNGDGDTTDTGETVGYYAINDWSSSTDVMREIIYYNAGGEIVGRVNHNKWTEMSNISGASQSASSTTRVNEGYVFNDGNWNWLGDTWSDGNFERAFFNIKSDTDADNILDKKVEIGSEGDAYWSREWIFNFDLDAQGGETFTGGTETENGISYTLDQNWTRSGGTADTTKLTPVTGTALENLNLPTSFIVDPTGTPTAYQMVKFTDQQGNQEIEYYDASGVKLGSSNVFTDFWSGDKVTNFNDANWNWLGEVRINYGDDKTLNLNDTKEVFRKSEAVVSGQTQKTDERIEYVYKDDNPNDNDASLKWVETNSSTFIYDDNGNLISGTEVRDGVTTEYGPGWEVKASAINVATATNITSSLSIALAAGNATTLNDLYDFSVDLNDDGDTTDAGETSGYTTSVSFTDPYGGGTNVETTYYNAAGVEVGRSNQYSGSYVDHNNATKTFVNVSYSDNDWNWLGNVSTEGDRVYSTFETKVMSGTTVTGYIEKGSETNTTTNALRQWEYNFDAAHKFTGGTQTENGIAVQITAGPNGEFQFGASTITIDASMKVTDTAELADLPDVFKFDDPDTTATTIDTAYRKVTSQQSWGTETTYFDPTGKEIGRSFESTDTISGSTNISFEDVNMHYLGSVFENGTKTQKKVMFETELSVADADGTKYIEVGKEYTRTSSTDPWTVHRAWEYKLDADHDLVSGTETSDNRTITLGADWVITGSSYAGTGQIPVLNEPEILEGLPKSWTTPVYAIENDFGGGNYSEWEFYSDAAGTLLLGTGEVYIDWGGRTEGDYRGPVTAEFDFYDVTGSWLGSIMKGPYDDGSSYKSLSSRTETFNGTTKTGYEYFNEYREFNSVGEIINSSASTTKYDINDDFIGATFTYDGLTEVLDANWDVVSKNVAPFAKVFQKDATSASQLAGQVDEDSANQSAFGKVVIGQTFDSTDPLFTDASDILSLGLMGGTSSTHMVGTTTYEKQMVGQYGTFYFSTDDGRYVYELNDSQTNSNPLVSLDSGQTAIDHFAVTVKDGLHEIVKAVDFEIAGADENTAASVNAGFLKFNDATKTYSVDTTKIVDADGVPASGFTFVWSVGGTVIGSATSASYKPNYADIGKALQVTVSFNDQDYHPNAETVTASATIGVANTAPVVQNPIADQSISDTGALNVSLNSVFADADGNTLSYSILKVLSDGSTAVAPTGMAVVNNAIQWSSPEFGSYVIRVTASDSMDSVSDDFILNVTSEATGIVLKGPVKNANVWLDMDGDGMVDAGEPAAITAEDGTFTIQVNDLAARSSNIAVAMNQNSIDTFSGVSYDGFMLTAPSGSTVVSLLSTLVMKANLTNSSDDLIAMASGYKGPSASATAIDIFQFNSFDIAMAGAPYLSGKTATYIDNNKYDMAIGLEAVNQKIAVTLKALQSIATKAGLSSVEGFEIGAGVLAERLGKFASDYTTDPGSFTLPNGLSYELELPTPLSSFVDAFVIEANNLIANEIAAGTTTVSTIQLSADMKAKIVDAIGLVNSQIDKAGYSEAGFNSVKTQNLYSLADDLADQIYSALSANEPTKISLATPELCDIAGPLGLQYSNYVLSLTTSVSSDIVVSKSSETTISGFVANGGLDSGAKSTLSGFADAVDASTLSGGLSLRVYNFEDFASGNFASNGYTPATGMSVVSQSGAMSDGDATGLLRVDGTLNIGLINTGGSGGPDDPGVATNAGNDADRGFNTSPGSSDKYIEVLPSEENEGGLLLCFDEPVYGVGFNLMGLQDAKRDIKIDIHLSDGSFLTENVVTTATGSNGGSQYYTFKIAEGVSKTIEGIYVREEYSYGDAPALRDIFSIDDLVLAVKTSNATSSTSDLRIDYGLVGISLSSASLDLASGTLTISGSNLQLFETSPSADVLSRLDLSKLSWDINGDNTTTPDRHFAASDFNDAFVTSGSSLTLNLTTTALTALKAAAGFGDIGGADKLDVAGGFMGGLSIAQHNVAVTYTGANTAFSIATSASDDVTVSSGSWQSSADLNFIDGSGTGTKDTLEFGNIVLDSHFVSTQLANLTTNNSLNLQFGLDQVGSFNSGVTEALTLTIRDQIDGGSNQAGIRDSGEREISVTFNVTANGDGSSGSITANPENVVVHFTKSDNSTGTLNLTNGDSDSFFVGSTGLLNTPNSLNLKLATLLQDLSSQVPVSMLSQEGTYEIELSGLGDLLEEYDGTSTSDLPVDAVRGSLTVVDTTPTFSSISFGYDADGASHSVTPTLVNATDKGDVFQSFSGVDLHEEVFVGFNSDNYQMPTISISLSDFENTSSMPGGKLTETVRIRLLEGDDNVMGVGERAIEATFDIERTGDGTSETWTAPAGGDLLIKYTSDASSNAAPSELTLMNGDADFFTATTSSNSYAISDSLELKLTTLLNTFETSEGITINRPSAGEDFHLTVAFVTDYGDEDILLSGDFSVI